MIDLSRRILITGATGYIGSRLIKRLLELGASHIYAGVNKNTTQISGVETYACDLSSKKEIEKMVEYVKPEYIIHLAAIGTRSTGLAYSLEELITVNSYGTIYLIDAVRRLGGCLGFLNISTGYEYGPKKTKITEQTLLSPRGNYALSKVVSSLYAIEQAERYDFPIVTYRLFSVYGPGDTGRVIPMILDAYLNGSPLSLFDIHQKRNFVHIDTVLFSLLEFDKVLKKGINLMNIGASESISIYTLLHLIGDFLQKDIPNNIILDGNDILGDEHWDLDISLFQETLSRDESSSREMLTSFIRSYTKNVL